MGALVAAMEIARAGGAGGGAGGGRVRAVEGREGGKNVRKGKTRNKDCTYADVRKMKRKQGQPTKRKEKGTNPAHHMYRRGKRGARGAIKGMKTAHMPAPYAMRGREASPAHRRKTKAKKTKTVICSN